METTVIDHFNITPTTSLIKFTKPSGFTYKPGQFINIELDIPDCDERCNKRNFTIASIDSDDYLMLATRHGVSRFKQTLQQLKKGDSFHIKAPLGHFVLDELSSTPAIMLSGGIGVTPLHAMTKYAAQHHLSKPITMIYSNAFYDDIPFKKDIDEYDKSDMQFRVHYTFTKYIPAGWTGERGRIDANMIQRLAPDWKESEYYICGPAQMVLELKKVVANMGVAAERIKFELFTGY